MTSLTASHAGRDERDRRDEREAVARLVGVEGARLAGLTRSVHQAVAGRVFRAVGPIGAPVRLGHDAISALVYGAVGGGLQLAGVAAASLAGRSQRRPRGAHTHSRRRAAALAFLNGAIGDELAAERNALAITMAVRHRHADLQLEPAGVAAAFPGATGHVVLFLHGLVEDEDRWHPRRPGFRWFGVRLAEDLGVTPVALRYNTGLPIAANGALLASLAAELVAVWPVPVERISIVGSSMGGLVARSGAHQASAAGAGWVRHLRHLVFVGTPHLGAPLEQGVNLADNLLALFPESAPFAILLRRRSRGIRDLRYGALLDADATTEPDALWVDATRDVPLVEGVAHHAVTATLTRDPRHPAGRLLGDLMVLPGSAAGTGGRGRRGRRIPFDVGSDGHVSTHHFDLTRHDAVYALLRDWLAA